MKRLVALLSAFAVMALVLAPVAEAKTKKRHGVVKHHTHKHYARSGCDYYCRFPLMLGIGY